MFARAVFIWHVFLLLTWLFHTATEGRQNRKGLVRLQEPTEGNPGINQHVPKYSLLSTDGIFLGPQDPGIPTQAHPVPRPAMGRHLPLGQVPSPIQPGLEHAALQ